MRNFSIEQLTISPVLLVTLERWCGLRRECIRKHGPSFQMRRAISNLVSIGSVLRIFSDLMLAQSYTNNNQATFKLS